MYPRKFALTLLAALVAGVGCAKINPDTKTATDTKTTQAAKPEQPIIGKWQLAQPGDTAIDCHDSELPRLRRDSQRRQSRISEYVGSKKHQPHTRRQAGAAAGRLVC